MIQKDNWIELSYHQLNKHSLVEKLEFTKEKNDYEAVAYCRKDKIIMSDTPMANRVHIGIYGKRNSGKSTLINALTGNNTALVSNVAGTTTDPVFKPIEIDGIGPCVLIDTAGFDDSGYLEQMGVEKTRNAMEKTDIALIVCNGENISQELEWAMQFKTRKIPVVMVINKIDQIRNTDKIRNKIVEALKEEPIKISAISKLGIEMVKDEILRKLPEDYDVKHIVRDQVDSGDTILMILPQENQDSHSRFILPQENMVRELLIKNCIILSCTVDNFEEALSLLTKQPKLIIAEATVYSMVLTKLPSSSKVISFSFRK